MKIGARWRWWWRNLAAKTPLKEAELKCRMFVRDVTKKLVINHQRLLLFSPNSSLKILKKKKFASPQIPLKDLLQSLKNLNYWRNMKEYGKNYQSLILNQNHIKYIPCLKLFSSKLPMKNTFKSTTKRAQNLHLSIPQQRIYYHRWAPHHWWRNDFL